MEVSKLMSKSIPGYKRIATEITKRIHHGEYASDTYLPSENQLAADFAVTRTTIRKALDILKSRGTIESFQGKGYKINNFQWEQSLLQFYSFGSNIAAEIENPETKVISFERIAGLKNIGDFINEKLWMIRRLRFMNKIPLILETSYIPVKLLPVVSSDKLKGNSLYSLLKENGVNVVKAKEYLEPVLPTLEEQEYLSIDNNTALFETIRYTYNAKEELIELRESLIRGDNFRFSVELTL